MGEGSEAREGRALGTGGGGTLQAVGLGDAAEEFDVNMIYSCIYVCVFKNMEAKTIWKGLMYGPNIVNSPNLRKRKERRFAGIGWPYN